MLSRRVDAKLESQKVVPGRNFIIKIKVQGDENDFSLTF